MNNQITISKLAQNPLIAYSIRLPPPEKLVLSEYEKTSTPAIFGNLTGLSMDGVVPKYRMGRVYSFDAFPRTLPDPVIIYSPIGNLSPYYKIWAKIMSDGMGSWRGSKIKEYDNAITAFVTDCFGLAQHEVVFAVIEMLKFKNDVVLRIQ